MSRRYNTAELREFVGEYRPQPSPAPEAHGTPSAEDRSTSANFEAIKSGCLWVQQQVDNPEGQPYDAWLAIGRIASRSKDGLAIFDAISRQDARYDPHETRAKFDEAFERMRPPTCAFIRENLCSSACDQCAVRFSVRSPMAFGSASPAVAELQSEYVIDAQTQRFASVRSRRIYPDKSFNTRFAHHAPKLSITQTLIRDRRSGKVEHFVYRPGEHRQIFDDGGDLIFNLWRDVGVTAKAGSCDIIMQHLQLLIPEAREREHFLDYLGFHVQNPGRKINHAVLIQGQQGTGKSFLKAVMKSLVGEENYTDIEPEMLAQSWTARWANVQAFVIEEMMTDGRLESYNKLKTWISEETVTVNEKFVPQYTASTPRIMLAMTNHKLATLLPQDDRRFFVINSPMERQDQAYYERLWNDGMAQCAAFKDFLLRRDVSGFRPGALPPMTEAKRAMIEGSLPPIQIEIETMIEEGAFPFHRALVRMEEVGMALQQRMGQRPRPSPLKEAMTAAGIKRRSGQVEVPGCGRPRLWIIRDHDFWQNCTPEEVRVELARPLNGVIPS